jgi:extracellular factor (EF) 3-hydroxypalmitic acid methyl ester biosynthesis protein
MSKGVSLLSNFAPDTAQRIISAGVERLIASGESVLTYGEQPDHLFVILNGTFAVRVGDSKGAPVAILGPGEVLGEISLLEQTPATGTVASLEDARVLSVPHLKLAEQIRSHPPFAADFYRGLAQSLAARLRDRSAALALSNGAADRLGAIAPWRNIVAEVQAFKRLLRLIDSPTPKDSPQQIEKKVHQTFGNICAELSEFVRQVSNKELLAEAEATLASEFTPYIHLTELTKRIVTKPRGYAGDFLTIDWIYHNKAGGIAPLGPLIDKLMLDRPSAHAVRNRRKLLGNEIKQALAKNSGSARITSLACGPAEEIFDIFEADPNAKIHPTLIDIDFQALGFVADRLQKTGFAKRWRLEHGNLVYLATGRQALNLEPQNLVYSIGLIDYFEDQFVVMLLNWIYDHLAPGGKVVLGNFHTGNPDRAFMDLVVDWKLIHRSEEDMNRLFHSSKFGRTCTEVQYEDAGVNMFACCVKDQLTA